MLDRYDIGPTLPAADIERAKAWYKEKLGFEPIRESPAGIRYQTGKTYFDVYPTQFAGTAQNTLAGWMVDDVEKVVEELRGRGVVFEEYDLPGLKTVNGIAELGGEKGAWFKDSEGNILSVAELTDF